MFSLIFSILWYLTLNKAKSVTIDGVYIVAPMVCDLVALNIIFN